jgi:hypothetical protein
VKTAFYYEFLDQHKSLKSMRVNRILMDTITNLDRLKSKSKEELRQEILTKEDYLSLQEYRKEKASGILTSHENLKNELGYDV